MKKPWILRLPYGVYQQPLALWVSLVCVSSGSVIGFGLSNPGSVADLLEHESIVRSWGTMLALTGVTLAYGVARSRVDIEKFALRVISILIAIWVVWGMIAVGSAAIVTVSLGLTLVFFCEVRIAVITYLINRVDEEN